MNFTKFERLKHEIARLGAKPIVAKLDKELLGEGVDLDNPEQVVTCEGGVYYIDPSGVVAKVILHMVEMPIDASYFKKQYPLVKKRAFAKSHPNQQLSGVQNDNSVAFKKTYQWYSK